MAKKRRRRRRTSASGSGLVLAVVVVALIWGIWGADTGKQPDSTPSAPAVTRSASRSSRQVTQPATPSSPKMASGSALANWRYTGTETVSVNHNQPTFTRQQLSLTHGQAGAWAQYGNLDRLNRVTTANAMLSSSLMPKTEREPLYVSPTGWHNKRYTVAGRTGYLYNRCHLIGYQLTGQNNNVRNLMTGTRLLNDPGMTTYENQVAAYLHAHPRFHLRYQVTPIFRGDELVARGVHMQGESIETKDVRFNVYLFNVQPGVAIDYATGMSRKGDPAGSF